MNSALEIAPHDREFRETIVETLKRLECLLSRLRGEGPDQWDDHLFSAGSWLSTASVGVLMGVRVLARVRPNAPFSKA